MTHVRDEQGVRHSTCHGVPAKDWFAAISNTARMLSKSEQRAQQGIMKLSWESTALCDDPDCNRLNRRNLRGPRAVARYKIVRNLLPVQPSDPNSAGEQYLCKGHPWKIGDYLCESCARVTMTKRAIDAMRATRTIKQ